MTSHLRIEQAPKATIGRLSWRPQEVSGEKKHSRFIKVDFYTNMTFHKGVMR